MGINHQSSNLNKAQGHAIQIVLRKMNSLLQDIGTSLK
jgi:hypothetical protein